MKSVREYREDRATGQQLSVKQPDTDLRITASEQIKVLTAKTSETDAVLRIANWPPFREKAVKYYQLVKMAEDPQFSVGLREFYVREANEILEREYPEGRKRQALQHILEVQSLKEDPEWQRIRKQQRELASVYADQSRLEGELDSEKYNLERDMEQLRDLAAKGWNLARTRKCQWCDKHFQIKRTDALFCSTNCRVQNWQDQRQVEVLPARESSA